MFDLQKLLLISIKKWWVYAISIFACLLLAGLLYMSTPVKFRVDASLMLRQADRNQGNQSEMINMMGGGGYKLAQDEIRVLTSRSLIEPIVEEMGLTTVCKQRKGLKWINTYPERPVEVELSQPLIKIVALKVTIKNGIVIIKNSAKLAQEGVQVHVQPGLEDGVYKVTVFPQRVAVAICQEMYAVSRDSRESNIIEISTASDCPVLAVEFINHMLDNYNLQTAMDKNLLAVQTDQFLSNRLEIITNELNQSENELEEYKRTHQITNLEDVAEEYRQRTEKYDLQIVDLDAKIRMLDYTESEIMKPENQRKVFPYVDDMLSLMTVGGVPTALSNLVSSYNASIARLNTLLSTLDDDHPLVKQELELIEEKRANILINIVQNRQNLALKRANILQQKKTYTQRLESIPEQDRTYREMKRNKNTKENQYVYLIQRREENAMLMASAAIPAITVDRAQVSPKKVSPKLSLYGLVAILLGVVIPCGVFVCQMMSSELEELKKKYLGQNKQ